MVNSSKKAECCVTTNRTSRANKIARVEQIVMDDHPLGVRDIPAKAGISIYAYHSS